MVAAPSIFISYRRDDAAGDAGRLADHLHRRFGPGRVFLDIDTIQPGADFTAVLRTSLEQTAAVLVVIGPRWIGARSAGGSRRLDDPGDFVRLEVETALGRGIPVVPVLVQGAHLPRADELPASLAPLVKRQVVVLDHAEFHADAERLCDRMMSVMTAGTGRPPWWRTWRAAAVAAVLAGMLGYAGYRFQRADGSTPQATGGGAPSPGQARRVEQLIAEAASQRQREQFAEALATLARARELAPASDPVRQLQEDVAMAWLRHARVESGTSSYAEAIKPALAVIDAALPAATGTRRADLLAHTGWASFLLWRDGKRDLNPAGWYEQAVALDPSNPYATAMHAHWILFRGHDVPRAVALFETAARSRRAPDVVRSLQWSAYRNANDPAADVQLVKLADAIRRAGGRLGAAEAQTLWAPYYASARSGRNEQRRLLLDAVPADDHIATVTWAFEEYAQADPSRRLTVRYYVALLHARAGRVDRAAGDLRGLLKDLGGSGGSLSDAVQAALTDLQRGTGSRQPPGP